MSYTTSTEAQAKFVAAVRGNEALTAAVEHLSDAELSSVFRAGYREGWKAIGGTKPAQSRVKWIVAHEGTVTPHPAFVAEVTEVAEVAEVETFDVPFPEVGFGSGPVTPAEVTVTPAEVTPAEVTTPKRAPRSRKATATK